jgi:FMN phosphatase YigB (HAD superfamily)
MLRVINSYSAITLIARSLVVFDIDDTLVNFPSHGLEWFAEKKAVYERIMPKEEADRRTIQEWRATVRDIDPVAIDKDGFYAFYERAMEAECTVIYLTARSPELKEATQRHLKNALGISSDHVYYAEDKGPALAKILETLPRNYDHVIFVDDYVKNHLSVRTTLDGLGIPVDTYHFQMM